MVKTVWTEAKETGLRAFAKQGMYAFQIAKELDMHPCTIRDYCKKNGITLAKQVQTPSKQGPRNAKARKSGWTDKRITQEQFLAAYKRAQTMTQLRDIVRIITGKDCGSWRLKSLIEELGLKPLKEDVTESIPYSQVNVGLQGKNYG